MNVKLVKATHIWVFVLPAIIIICACTLIAILFSVKIKQIQGIQTYRLSRFVTPLQYTIHIEPDFEQNIFYGKTLVYVYTKSALEEISLHSRNLTISTAFINSNEASIRYDENEKISVYYKNDSIQPGLHYIYINYTGIIHETGGGFLRAPFGYEDEDIYVYVTDLEPSNARKIFPCFDEPYFKAKFSLKLTAPDGYEAISNMPEISRFSSSVGTVHTFETSVRMATYLVSFAFTQFPYYEDTLEDNGKSWPIRIYSLNASEENNQYAINCTKRALQYYSEYTNISYPLPKLDMIEYERNESAATENWGLVTFRKGLLSPNLKLYEHNQIELVIYHELSHFWFGNLVTNDWWNDLWLQEGFAVYMSYKLSALQRNRTQLRNMQDFQYDVYLEFEYLNNSNSVVSHLPRSDDILKKFDNLVYDKGAAVLLMLENIIGEYKFRLSIQTFLKRYAYQTATTNDFISVVEEIAPRLPIRSFMESFLYQNKFPIVNIEDINGTFMLQQKVCQSSTQGPSLKSWTIPISYITDKNDLSNPKLMWFDRDMDTLEIIEPDIKWIVFNPKGLEMYKVELSDDMWENLIQNFEGFERQVAEAIISNAVYLFKYDLINCDIIINFIKELNDIKKMSIFGEFNAILLKSLNCSKKDGYKNAASIYWSFLERHFNKTYGKGYLYSLCDNRDSIEIGDSLQRCVDWISNDLDETTNEI